MADRLAISTSGFFRGRASALVLAGALSLGFAGAASAQGTSAPAPSAPGGPATTAPADQTSQGAIPTIEVTAEFRRENLQNTPIAITAVNAAMLDARSQTNLTQITAQAPNVTLKPAGQAFADSLVAYIRGVGQTDFDYASEPGVGVYVDDVYYATITGNQLDLLDLDRVEILRGPQGTLAGRNAIGGAIELHTKQPDGNGGGWIEGTYGSLNKVEFRGSGDFTIVPDKLFVRFAGSSETHDGYVTRLDYACTHPGSGLPTLIGGGSCKLGSEGGKSVTSGRVAVRWVPADNFTVNLSFDITNDNSEATPEVLRQTAALSPEPIYYDVNHNGNYDPGTDIPYDNRFVTSGPFAGDPLIHDKYVNYSTYLDNRNGEPIPGTPGTYTTGCPTLLGPPLVGCAASPYLPYSVPPTNDFKGWGTAATFDWQLADNISLKSITAYRYYTNVFAQDDNGAPITFQLLQQTLVHRQISQEIRLSGTAFNNFIDYTAGGFYMSQSGYLTGRIDLPYVGFDFVHGPDTTPSTSQAGFLNIAAHPSDKLTVEAGLRYSYDTKDYTFHRHNPDGTLPTAPCGPFPLAQWDAGVQYNCGVFGLDGNTANFQSHRLDYRGVVSYKWTPEFMTYVQTSTGYKGGGINARPFVPDQELSFEPEKLTEYEVGFKSELFNRIRFNGAYFYNLYHDIQLTRTNCASFSLSPVCILPINGGDADVWGLEGELEAHPTDNLELDASYSYLHFQYKLITDPSTGITLNMITPYTPTIKYSVGAQYTLDLPGQFGTLTPRLDWSYQSKTYALPTNAATNQINGYGVGNFRLTWKDEDQQWEAAAEVTNLFDKFYFLNISDFIATGGDFVSGEPGMPREFAFHLTRKF